MTTKQAIRILATTFVAAVMGYGVVFCMKMLSYLTHRPDYFALHTWNGCTLFILLQCLGLCYAVKIFGGDLMLYHARTQRI